MVWVRALIRDTHRLVRTRGLAVDVLIYDFKSAAAAARDKLHWRGEGRNKNEMNENAVPRYITRDNRVSFSGNYNRENVQEKK